MRKSWLLPFGMVFTKQVFPVKLKEKPERPEISINEKLTDTFYKIDEYLTKVDKYVKESL